jgi:uncharacterized protein (DUF2252 family)
MHMTEEMKNQLVVVTTKYRGTYVGVLKKHALAREQAVLADARMVIYWGTTRGYQQLAASGPTPTTKLADKAPLVWICGVTSIDVCSPAAAEAWGNVS